MNQKSTPDHFFAKCRALKGEIGFSSPSKKTLLFLKQFASSYHVEKELPKELSTLLLN